MSRLRSILKYWLPLAVAITLLTGLMYVAVQQVSRISANDPQIQMAEDTASALSAGQSIDSVVPASKIDIATGLAPYIVVFDDSGKAIAGSGLLHNQLPTLPAGVFDSLRQKGESRITWQPEPGVRSATVVTRFTGTLSGFVMAGRSLREVEKRTDQLLWLISLGGIAILLAALAAVAVSEVLFSNDPA